MNKDPSSLLADIKQRSVTWIDVVRTLGKLESRSTTDDHGRPWARVVAEQSGNSLNQLRKMQRTVRTVEHLANRNSFDLEKLLQSVPFSQVEILARIAKADEEVAIHLIRTCLTANRLPTYRELLERFYEIRDAAPQVSSIAAGQRTARKFEGICFDLLSQTKATILPGFSGESVKVLRWSGGLRFASPDLIIARRDDTNALVVDAVDCYAIYGDVGQDETAKRMVRVATESTFFRNFWILMPTWSPAWLVASMSNELELRNVGVVTIDPETKEKEWVRVPPPSSAPEGKPVPDRQDKAAADLKRLLRNA